VHAIEQIGGAKIDVLIELASHGKEQAMHADSFGDAGPADGAKEDGVMPGEVVPAAGGNNVPVLLPVLAAPGKAVPVELGTVPAARRLDDGDGCLDHFRADAITADDCNPMLRHASASIRFLQACHFRDHSRGQRCVSGEFPCVGRESG
jgi:hypothetical protein